jgi:hypothetical protein
VLEPLFVNPLTIQLFPAMVGPYKTLFVPVRVRLPVIVSLTTFNVLVVNVSFVIIGAFNSFMPA